MWFQSARRPCRNSSHSRPRRVRSPSGVCHIADPLRGKFGTIAGSTTRAEGALFRAREEILVRRIIHLMKFQRCVEYQDFRQAPILFIALLAASVPEHAEPVVGQRQDGVALRRPTSL
jgi:hypothetical protein